MKNFLILLFILVQLNISVFAQIFVSPTGNDNNPGTFDLPFRTLTKAVSVAGPDSLIYMRGGIYNDSTTHTLNKSGTSGHYIKVWAYPGEIPILDFSNQPVATTSRGIRISHNYWHLKGLTIRNAKDNGIYITSYYNIVENCILYNNNDTGIQISNGGSYNLVLNCDSYMNFDPLTFGENADGFAAKLQIGPGNVFRGCRAWNNSDDGYDTYEASDTVLIDQCWAFRNGDNIWGINPFNGDGNGFKLGGGTNQADPHKIIRSVAFDNPGKGFDQNNNVAGVTLYNNTAWGNGYRNFSFPTQPTSGVHILKNNISFEGQNSITANSIQEANSWQGFTVTSADFKSLDSTLAILPRDSLGHLPYTDLLRLAAGSSLIDTGVDVGLPFYGSAPDLGAFETDGVTSNENEIVLNQFQLYQNFPNPFNPSTTITYSLKESGNVRLEIYDVLGNKMAEPVNEFQNSGNHTIKWIAKDSKGTVLPSGIYFAKLQWEDLHKSIKIILMK